MTITIRCRESEAGSFKAGGYHALCCVIENGERYVVLVREA